MTLNPVVPLRMRVPEWTFAERLRKARRDSGLSQTEMAARLGIKESRYSAWETGRNRPDIADVAAHLEGITGISRLWFLGWSDGPQPSPDGGTSIGGGGYTGPEEPTGAPSRARTGDLRFTLPTIGPRPMEIVPDEKAA